MSTRGCGWRAAFPYAHRGVELGEVKRKAPAASLSRRLTDPMQHSALDGHQDLRRDERSEMGVESTGDLAAFDE